MRQFDEDDLRRAQRHVREAERRVARQNIVILRFEAVGDAEEVGLAREYLVMCEKSVDRAREALCRQQKRR